MRLPAGLDRRYWATVTVAGALSLATAAITVPRHRWWAALMVFFVGVTVPDVIWPRGEPQSSRGDLAARVIVSGTILVLVGFWTYSFLAP